MKLIVGLGNIGEKYSKTRHNAGFLVADLIAESLNVDFSEKKNLNAYIAKFTSDDANIIIAKPTTMMNESGLAVRKIIDYYDIDIKNLIVIVDDLDRGVGKLRIKKTGSSGGHNGLKSIEAHLGVEEFLRIRVGIGRPEHNQNSVINHVLGDFSKSEFEELTPIIDNAAAAALELANGQALNKVTSKYNN